MTLDCQRMTAVLNQARTSGTNAVLGLEKAMLPGLQVSWRPGRMRFLGACWDSKSYSSSASPSRQAWRKGVLSPKRLFSRFRISTGPERMRFWGRFGAKTGTVS